MTTIQSISEDQLGEAIVASLHNITKNEGFVEYEKYVRSISTNGGNFLGDLFEVDIKGKSTDGDKEINLFLKKINHEISSPFINVQVLQDREILAYGELAKLYTQLMNDANIPESERYRQARCYDATDDFLILENLTVKGYRTLERTTSLSLSFAETAIKQLAKFHALSFVLQNKHKEYFDSNLKHLSKSVGFSSFSYFTFIKNSFDICCDLLDGNGGKRLRAAYRELTDVEKHFGEPKRCLCHGDYRSNNMMIKEEKGKTLDLLPVDFQALFYSNPMNDFWFLIISHTDHEFRRKHLTTLKELYYNTLTQFLKYFEMDVSSVYPRKEFDADYKERTIFGLYSSILLIPVLFAKEDALMDISDVNSLKSKVIMQNDAKERMQGIVDDYIEWGII